jgi:diaminopimelate epimerase
MRKIKYTKMHGLGNDYVYINGLDQNIDGINLVELSIKVSDRVNSIGSDGLILILPSDKADFRMLMFNADGSEGEMCGNGIRCVAKYVYDRKISEKKELDIETKAGIKKTRIVKGNDGKATMIEVDMGEPVINDLEIEVDSNKYSGKSVTTGNPHFILIVDNFDFDYRELGKKIENHAAFKNKTNVEFIKVNDKNDITMRVWERGSGETKACGTGACASVAAAASLNKTDRVVTVHLPGGDLKVKWGDNNHLYMTGPAEEMETGELEV